MNSTHPLDPLTAEEIRAAAAVVKRDCGVTDRWRFASIDLKEPPKQALSDATTRRPPGRGRVLEPRRRRRLQGRRIARGRAPDQLDPAAPWRAPADDARRVPRGRPRAPHAPTGDRSSRAKRRHRHGPRPVRHLGVRRRARARALPGPADRLGRRVAPQLAGGEPVREHAQRAPPGRRPEHDGAARARGRRPRPRAGDHGRVRTRTRSRTNSPRRSQTPRHHPARRPVVHARRQPRSAGRSGRCGSGSTIARVW